jgi:hypothetical protein
MELCRQVGGGRELEGEDVVSETEEAKVRRCRSCVELQVQVQSCVFDHVGKSQM